ncbi:MAG: ABC transporter ATP-binding protein [Omnitrophica WOR_2 bacterium]
MCQPGFNDDPTKGGTAISALAEVRNLKVIRDGTPILDIASLTIEQGEVLAVIGPNGAGKSTLLLALAGLIRPDAGEILFRGQPLTQIGDVAYRRQIGLVLQEPLLLDGTVIDNVTAGLHYRHLSRSEARRRAGEWLQPLGISHLRDRKVNKLSGGEAQRTSLARAFALQPGLLLLDEPFSALDAPTRSRLLQDFQALLCDHPVTTIFITHDLDEALLLGDRVAVLLGGRVRQAGAPQEVFSAPVDDEVAAFVGVETVIPGRVIESRDGQIQVEGYGLKLQAIGEFEPGRQVLFCLRPEDVTVWPQENSPASSARNRLAGRILRLSPQGPLVHVTLDCGFPLYALITRASASELELKEGGQVTAAFKATAVHIIPR